MTHPSKRKGNRYEREIVEEAEAKGLEAERAFASDGRSLGESEECDVLIRGREEMITDAVRIQAKRRKNIANYITPDEDVDIQVVRENYGDSLAIVPLGFFLDLLREATGSTDTNQ
jgi:Holliday junction resolvase